MNTKQIDYVLELANTLNFSRAAENLFISQPSLTYQIQLLENEVGIRLFERSGKGAALTPAGEMFCSHLRHIKDELKTAIEQSRNIGSKYDDILNVCLPMRSCVIFLPEIIKRFEETMPSTALNINYIYDDSRLDLFFKREQDIIFARESAMKRFGSIGIVPLFDSHFYIVVRKDDPLSELETVSYNDITGRTLMIGGGSPPEMIVVQNRIINTVEVNTINSSNHESSLTNVAAGRGIVLAPGFTNDHNGEFAWIPFDCSESIKCVLAYHKDDTRECTRYFTKLAQDAYKHADNVAL